MNKILRMIVERAKRFLGHEVRAIECNRVITVAWETHEEYWTVYDLIPAEKRVHTIHNQVVLDFSGPGFPREIYGRAYHMGWTLPELFELAYCKSSEGPRKWDDPNSITL